VVLHYYLGMPLPEVASTLNIPVGTVKSRLHRALGTMRVAMSDVTDEPQREPIAGGQLA
jgi:DNA-directed RNA polymerase specialized sigma24 family protein